MARPLSKTYSTTHPYVVERHDQEDGSITYEIWDHRPDSYRRLCSINEDDDSSSYSDEDGRPTHNAKSDAEMIARALNLNCGAPRVNEMTDSECEKYQRALGIAVDALRLYADEGSYHAIAIMADRPAGAFADDFSRVKDSDYNRPMPGKAARKALLKLTKTYGDLSYSTR